MDRPNGSLAILEGEDLADSNMFINPHLIQRVDNTRFERVGFCARTSSRDGTQRTPALSRAIENLKRIWSNLIFDPSLHPSTVDIMLRGSSTRFEGLEGDVVEVRNLFWQGNSALVVSGLDGITTDIHGFLRFLDSEQHKHSVDIFILEHGDLRVHTTSKELQLVLQEQVKDMPELSRDSTSMLSSVETSTSAPATQSPLEELIADWEIANWAKKLMEIESQISLALDTRSRNGPSPYGDFTNAQALLQTPQSLIGERIHGFLREIAHESMSSSQQTLGAELQTRSSLSPLQRPAPTTPATTMPSVENDATPSLPLWSRD